MSDLTQRATEIAAEVRRTGIPHKMEQGSFSNVWMIIHDANIEVMAREIPKIYDISADELRAVTQEDVDRMVALIAKLTRPQPDMFSGERQDQAPEHLQDAGWEEFKRGVIAERLGYRGTIYGDGIHGTDEICGELSEGV